MSSYSSSHFGYNTPFGVVTIAASGGALVNISLGATKYDSECSPSTLTNNCANQLLEYFSGKRSEFDLPYELDGTDFQKQVWEAATLIPYGQTRTPAEIAKLIGHPSSYRLVSQAVSKNPLVILIPAHRIVPASGLESTGSRSSKLRAAFRELEKRYS